MLHFFPQQLHYRIAAFLNNMMTSSNHEEEQHADYYTLVSFLIAIAIVVVTVVITIFRTKYRNEKEHSLLPSEPLLLLPPSLPPMGPTFSEFLTAQKDGRLTELQTIWVEKYGPIFTIPSPFKGLLPNFVVVADPSLTKELCIVQTNQYRPPSRFTTRSEAFAAATRNSVGMSLAASTGW
jgi:cytochrome bd-type quinol oxidase subunit 2